jgi:hypothetical protein
VEVDEIIDRLYGLRLDEFTGARNQAAAELRKEGRREEAEHVKGLRKPTAGAAAVNRLVRGRRHEVEQFLRAAEVLRDAQFAGKGDFAAATRDQRGALERLTRAGGEAVRSSLLAAAVDEEAAEELLRARLERELEPRGFGSLLSFVPSAEPKARSVPRGKRKPDLREARTRLHDAEKAVAAAQAAERQARRSLEKAQREHKNTEAALERARRELERLQAV